MDTMMFADDLLILSTSAGGLQNSIDILREYCAEWKLHINIKTKIMTILSTKLNMLHISLNVRL